MQILIYVVLDIFLYYNIHTSKNFVWTETTDTQWNSREKHPKSTGMVYLFFYSFNWQLFFVLYAGEPYLRPSKFGSRVWKHISHLKSELWALSLCTVCYFFHRQTIARNTQLEQCSSFQKRPPSPDTITSFLLNTCISDQTRCF